MSEPDEKMVSTDTPGSGASREASAAIIAALVGLLALLVAGYTAWIQRQQVRAEVWPYLELGESDSLPTDVVGGETHGGLLVAFNKGVGPAIVRSLVVQVDGTPQRDWQDAFKSLGFDTAPPFNMSSLNNSVLSPGERLDFLTILGAEQWARFKSKLGSDIVVRACYCSTLGECWTSVVGFYKKRHWGQSVDSCSQMAKQEQFRD